MSPNRTNLQTDADRFWSRVDRSGDCWLWTGAKYPDGYGKVVVGQEVWRAHRLAWFMVMGTLPSHNLYHIGGRTHGTTPVFPTLPKQWTPPVGRGCVRPHHFRDGPPESAPSRWAKRATSGFPPEFRSVKDDLIQTDQAERDFMPLLLYRGALTAGRAQALFNFTLAAQAAEAERLGDVVAMSRAWPDVSHAVGLHKPITAVSTVGQFWMRILDNPTKIGGLRPGLTGYIRDVLKASDHRPIKLTAIDRYSQWTTRDWRKPPRVERTPKLKSSPLDPMTEVWPFIPATPNPEHALVLAVDQVVPKSVPEHVRQDACQDLMLAVLSGEFAITDLNREMAGAFVKNAFRMYPGKYGPMSLDAAMGDTDRTLLDTLADAPIILDGGFGSLAELRDQLRAQEAAA